MRIWKFRIDMTRVDDEEAVALEMPANAAILDVQAQEDVITLWALVDPHAATVVRTFRVVGTGQPLPETPLDYLGTVQIYAGMIVLHVFEVTE